MARAVRRVWLLPLLAPAVALALVFGLRSSASGSGNLSDAPQNETAKSQPAPVAEQPAAAAPSSAPAAPAPPPTKAADAKKVVVIDPGHGGDEVGAARNGVVEKASNLDMALRLEKILLAEGYDVVLTRRTDTRAAGEVAGYTATRTDLQARIDIANEAKGDIFVSLHSNGSDDLSQRGVEAWYDSKRTFATENQALARSLLNNVLGELHTYGYDAQNRGLLDGSCFRERNGRCFTLFVIGGPRETTRREVEGRGGNAGSLGFPPGTDTIYSRATNMPAVLVENLIITNASDAAVLRDEAGRNAIARGLANGIEQFLSAP